MTHADRSDDDLMLAYRDGEAAAFEALYARHRVALYNYLRRHLGSHGNRADELFQETWLKVIDAQARFESEGRFASWLFRIAHNLMVDAVRRGARSPVSYADPATLSEVAPAAGPGPEDDATADEQARRLRRAVEGLPEAQRETFLLREEAGLELEEIAALTGVGIETAKSRLRYAIKALRAALRGEGEKR